MSDFENYDIVRILTIIFDVFSRNSLYLSFHFSISFLGSSPFFYFWTFIHSFVSLHVHDSLLSSSLLLCSIFRVTPPFNLIVFQIKASEGGGGKGIRRCLNEVDFKENFVQVQVISQLLGWPLSLLITSEHKSLSASRWHPLTSLLPSYCWIISFTKWKHGYSTYVHINIKRFCRSK